MAVVSILKNATQIVACFFAAVAIFVIVVLGYDLFTEEEIPPELICTAGYPCYDQG